MNRQRLAGLGLVAALHVAIVAALLTLSNEKIAAPHAAPVKELIWLLPPPPKEPRDIAPPKPSPDKTRQRPPAATPLSPNPSPDYRGITIPNAPPTASLGGLHGSLFGCADLDKLTPEARAHCGSALAVPDNTVDYRDGTGRSRMAALWERGRERKNAPLLLPCMSPQGPPNPLALAACLAKAAAQGGIKSGEQASYADTSEAFHLPNNGDPPDKPTNGP